MAPLVDTHTQIIASEVARFRFWRDFCRLLGLKKPGGNSFLTRRGAIIAIAFIWLHNVAFLVQFFLLISTHEVGPGLVVCAIGLDNPKFSGFYITLNGVINFYLPLVITWS